MSSKVTWGIIGAGSIAQAFARGVNTSKHGTLLAVASRSLEKAEKFAKEFNVAKAYGSYEAILADKEVQGVYIATPHPLHAEWAIKAVRAGKHIIVEKPFAVNWADAMAVFEAAEVAGVFAMEAFMYRCHPATAKVAELVKSKAIGDVRVISATFSFHAGFNAESRLFANDYAGGGILDVGCYTVSLARLIAGAALGKDFADPFNVSGAAHLGETGVDEWAVGTLKFPGGIVAQIATGVAVNQDNTVRIFGSEGNIVLPNAWLADRHNPSTGKIIINRNGKPAEEIVLTPEQSSFSLEVDVASEAILAGKKEAAAPAMSIRDTLGNLQTLDQWRRAIGLAYDIEKAAKFRKTTVSGESLSVKPNVMKYARIAHLDKKISRLVLGCDNQQNLSHGTVMFDDFFEKGGNTFDTAFIYGGGSQERLLGEWIKMRGVRDQVNVIVKGCHTPNCDPFSLDWQLRESLKRLQIESADIYMMHRDNPELPASAFIDELNKQVKAGRIKAFGGSNWALSRVQEANDYAKSKGLQGFSVVSNNFSLARMVNPVWDGCVYASDPASRKWLAERELALLSWSSQARGFFVPGLASPDKTDDKEMVRCWYSEDNFQRQARAFELAKKKNVLPINIALAYVLAQPFPTIALIGPRQLSETRTSLPGLTVELTPDEVKWLNLGE